MRNSKGFLNIVVGIAVIAVLIGGGYWYWQQIWITNEHNDINQTITATPTEKLTDGTIFETIPFGVRFQYPSAWIVNEHRPNTNDFIYSIGNYRVTDFPFDQAGLRALPSDYIDFTLSVWTDSTRLNCPNVYKDATVTNRPSMEKLIENDELHLIQCLKDFGVSSRFAEAYTGYIEGTGMEYKIGNNSFIMMPYEKDGSIDIVDLILIHPIKKNLLVISHVKNPEDSSIIRDILSSLELY